MKMEVISGKRYDIDRMFARLINAKLKAKEEDSMKEAIKKTPKKKAAWKPIEFRKGEHEALDRQIFRKKCKDPKFVARCIEENLKWRRGEGPYAFNADPKKNARMPLCPQALSLIEEAAIIHLKAYDNFKSPKYESKDAAIDVHNRMARAVRAAKEGEVK